MRSKQKPIFPVVNGVKDLSSGCAVAAVIHYYCPGLLRLEGTNTQPTLNIFSVCLCPCHTVFLSLCQMFA